jgi:ATP-dependent protease ClpP protease subunit
MFRSRSQFSLSASKSNDGRATRYRLEEPDTEESASEYGNEVKVQNNDIYFFGAVSTESMLELSLAIKKLSKQMLIVSVELGIDPPPINIYIHSEGGEVHAALSVFDLISNNLVHINTIITGNASSAATIISMAGHTRKITRNSYMLIHNISSAFWGKMHEFEDEMQNMAKLTMNLKQIYKDYGNIKKKQLDELLRKDLLLDAGTCLKYGFVDEIC